MTSQEKITNKALELFNKNGIEYVGMRELAASLNMRIGNITYYYPTKNDLVYKISMDMAKLNSETIKESEDLTMLSFLQMFRQVFYNHAQYRCLMLSFVHLLERNPTIAENYNKRQEQRHETNLQNLKHLSDNGYLNTLETDELEFLVSCISLIARFWVSESTVTFKHLSLDQQISHYLGILVRIIKPFATEKGRNEIDIFLKEIKK